MKWLITGGCGFIGTSLVRSLVAEGGNRIRIIDNLAVGTRADLSAVCAFKEIERTGCKARQENSSAGEPAVELLVGDIRDEDLAVEVSQGMDIIVHLAANTGVGPSVENPRLDCTTNVIGTLNYLEAARRNGVKRFVFASSGAPVGECIPPIHEELAPHPVSPYGASKLAGEGYCSAYFRTFGIETVALRFGNVYGPLSGHKNSAVAKFIKQAMQGETLEIYGDGRQTRDFIFIDDLVKAIQLAASAKGVGGEIFQIATNAETTVSELVDCLVPLLEEQGFKGITIVHGSPRLGDVRRNFSDTSKAGKMLGWKSEVGLIEGLRRTVEWFVEQQLNG